MATTCSNPIDDNSKGSGSCAKRSAKQRQNDTRITWTVFEERLDCINWQFAANQLPSEHSRPDPIIPNLK